MTTTSKTEAMSGTTTAATPEAQRAAVARGRRMLLGLAALFFVPLGLSFWLYYAGGWRPSNTTNKGELISPARPLPDVPFTLPDGTTSARAGLLREKWSLVYLGNGGCAEDCRQALWTMRQTRQLLAADMDRVQRVFIVRGECCDMDFLAKEHAGLEVVKAEDPSTGDFFALFPATEAAHSVYVVDPLGNLMMRFDARENPKGLLSDMKKLLKLSHIG
jgi:cytochrome oxidase Cu insertion factor (SCO1/SenC/PrrC family)